ncbi:DUF5331 domain-containing protein [Anabaena sp. UHCC 0399]|uniref:DUF5331 domain-containing protein n=1 Tax=Anabaena sp. UHCC 0399 TaxID=3110238 RepID=UPI002B206D1B|nr:DUF5331 domain-containing protein [Anabaena sp. UHCC 0399]MEA5568834.1 DUF5331 domain-containing protein [Anabaena sp. UHCC 0399]
MAFFNSFTDSIRQKWLQFFQANRDWIKLHMQVESVYTPDGGKRPPSYLILGVLNALEPKLAQLMFPFAKLNPDADTLIEVLDLNFDPDMALGNSVIPQDERDHHQHQSNLSMEDNNDDETFIVSHTNGFGEDTDSQTLIMGNIEDTFNGLEASSQEEDDFDDVSFDVAAASVENLQDQMLEDLNTPDENAFSDVLSDVWGDETSLQKDEESNDFMGEELPAGVFDESEIARLFPNA